MKALALIITAVTLTTATPGTYHADTQSVTDFYGEEWGYDADLPDGTAVIITFDTTGTENIYDDEIISLISLERTEI